VQRYCFFSNRQQFWRIFFKKNVFFPT